MKTSQVVIVALLLTSGHVRAGTVFVWTNSPTPQTPFSSWGTAAHSVQDGIDAALAGDTVLVTNGVYRLESAVVITNAIKVASVNGPAVTVLDAVAPTFSNLCAILDNSNAILQSVTLMHGGAGVVFGVGGLVSECVIVSNWTGVGDADLGGVVDHSTIMWNSTEGAVIDGQCTIKNSIIAFNSGPGLIVGDDDAGTVMNCLVMNNGSYGIRADNGAVVRNCFVLSNGGGGIVIREDARAVNCTVIANTGFGVYLHDHASSVINTLSWFHTRGGEDDIVLEHDEFPSVINCWYDATESDDPLFVATNDFHLALGSPCIDVGMDQPDILLDFDGVPRPLDGDDDGTAHWDIGACEFVHPTADTDGDQMPDQWELIVGLSPTNAAGSDGPVVDVDGDDADNLAEYVADTDPFDPQSVLKLTAITPQAGGMRVDWQGGVHAWQILEVKEQLADTNTAWNGILGIPPPTPTPNAVIDLGTTNQVLFYRIRAHR